MGEVMRMELVKKAKELLLIYYCIGFHVDLGKECTYEDVEGDSGMEVKDFVFGETTFSS